MTTPMAAMSSSVRGARPTDAPAIAAIYDAAVARGGMTLDTRPIPATLYAEQMAAPDHLLLVVEVAGRVRAWGRLSPWSVKPGYRPSAEASVFVALDAVRQGHGLRLLNALVDAAPDLGYHHIVGRVWTENANSLAICREAGFERVGVQREVGRVGGRWVDVTIVQRIVPGGPWST